jgi:hypothetical protein
MARVGIFKRIGELLAATNIAAKPGSRARGLETPAPWHRTAPNVEAAMIERDPKIVQSDLSRTVKQDGVTVEVSIIRLSISQVSQSKQPGYVNSRCRFDR